MIKGKSHIIISILLLVLNTNLITFAQTVMQNEQLKLAILKIRFEDFTEAERERVNLAFFEHLVKDARVSIMPETQARGKLIPFGIEPYEISDITGYVHAGQLLNVDFVLVGNMDKIGDFVEVTFRIISMPKGLQKRYPGGKTFDIFINEEIPKIVNMIYDDMNLQKQSTLEHINRITSVQKTGKKRPSFWITVGGIAVGGLVTAIVLSSGGDDKQESGQALPRPPIVP